MAHDALETPPHISLSAPKGQRNEILDGLRGIAAVAVVIYHLGQVLHLPLLPGAYLAVGFFFVLSGFVLCRAYDHKSPRSLPLGRFVVMRLVRLYPLLLLGVVLGLLKSAAVYYMAAASTHSDLHQVVIAGMLNSLCLPVFSSSGPIFPLNVPQWSLFFELLASILLLVLFVRGPLWLPYVFALSGAGVMAMYAAIVGGGLNVGWDNETFRYGFARVTYAFSMGVIIARRSKTRFISRPFLALLILVGLPLLYEWDAPARLLGIRDLTTTFLISPAVIALGSRISAPQPMRRFLAFLGDVSYPLYATHYPMLLCACFIGIRLGFPSICIITLSLITTLSFAFIAGRYFDQPARAWLSRRLRLRESARPAVL